MFNLNFIIQNIHGHGVVVFEIFTANGVKFTENRQSRGNKNVSEHKLTYRHPGHYRIVNSLATCHLGIIIYLHCELAFLIHGHAVAKDIVNFRPVLDVQVELFRIIVQILGHQVAFGKIILEIYFNLSLDEF